MHILILILTVIGGAGFWYYRMRDAGRAAGEVIDHAQRAKGAFKRKKFRDKAAQSPFTAVDDPVVAAVTAIIAIAEECGSWDASTRTALEQSFASVSNKEALEEAVIYGEWAVKQTTEMSGALRHLGPSLADMLTVSQREDLMAMADNILPADADNAAIRSKGLRLLRQKMGLVDK